MTVKAQTGKDRKKREGEKGKKSQRGGCEVDLKPEPDPENGRNPCPSGNGGWITDWILWHSGFGSVPRVWVSPPTLSLPVSTYPQQSGATDS